ncbi:PREDICTED: uncharacterized protein LOC109172444 [Ipomoea nil]|uniref:uncharacterized protein LOC109172444 n=1 Tax=Ipomoea nil TaxID=35883 RepID=UPI000900D84A|nr:PREDICTED: uncharacterized protein LOC109172444 [Ipomoea nil]
MNKIIMMEDCELMTGKSPHRNTDGGVNVTAADELESDQGQTAGKGSSGSEAGKEEDDDRVIKELKKIQRQNFVTHCLVSAMIVLTLTWQLSEVSLILKLKDGLNNPFRSLGGFIAGMFKRPDKPILINNVTEDENPATGKQEQGVDAIKIPDLPHLDLPSLGFITEEK